MHFHKPSPRHHTTKRFAAVLLATTVLWASPHLSRAAEPPAVAARALAREAATAAAAKDYATYLTKIEAAVALRPDYPRLLVSLASAQALNLRPDAAITTLNRLADLGVYAAVEKSEALASLRERKDFAEVSARFAANLRPIGPGVIAYELPGMTGLIEGIVYRAKTKDFFFGDVHERAVWIRTQDGTVKRFTTDNPAVLGVFGLAIDEPRGSLWAATSALPAMRGFTAAQKGTAGVAEFDLATGQLRRVARLPADHGDHVIGDLALGPDGSIYLPDSGVPVLWRLAPGADAPEKFLESAEFISLQGAIVLPSGKALLLSDYANGLLRVDLTTLSVHRLDAPPNTTLLSIDGLALAPDGTVRAVQNGVRPLRVLALTLDPTADKVVKVTVLDSSHPAMADPTLGCFAGDEFYFVGEAGWDHFEKGGAEKATARSVPIFRSQR